MDCMFDKDYTLLASDKSLEEQKALWTEIVDEYCQLLGDQRQEGRFNLLKRIIALQTKIESGKLLLKYHKSEDALEALRKIGYDGDKKKIMALMKKDIVLLANAVKEHEQAHERKDTGNEKEKFEEWIISISRFMGFPLKENETTVYKFIMMAKRMEKPMLSVQHK